MVILLCLFLLRCCHAEFTSDFRAFIHIRFQISKKDKFIGFSHSYGISLVHQLERGDLVVIVHGITNRITRFSAVIAALRQRGIEVFGTTWGDGGVTPAGLVELKCAHVKQIRSMIIAVREYTGRKVDIIAYSMGAPLARKAMLGGVCVETRELLGPPLTEHVDTFLSVAGANYGSALCLIPVPLGTCNRKNGLHCESEFLRDVNAQNGYEGAHTFSIFSTGDEKVGFRVCSRLASPIVGGTGFVKKEHWSHDDVLDKTVEMQINFVQKHRPK